MLRTTAVPRTAVTLSTSLTQVFGFTDYCKRGGVLFAFENADAAKIVTLEWDTSQMGNYEDDAQSRTITIPPLKEWSIEIGPDQLRKYFSAYATTSAGTSTLYYQVVAADRE